VFARGTHTKIALDLKNAIIRMYSYVPIG